MCLGNPLIVRLVLHSAGQDDDERPAGSEDCIADILRLGLGDGVEHNLDRCGSDFPDLRDEGGVGEVAIEDVRRAQALQMLSVAEGGRSDDGAEASEFRELDDWKDIKMERVLVLSICVPY